MGPPVMTQTLIGPTHVERMDPRPPGVSGKGP